MSSWNDLSVDHEEVPAAYSRTMQAPKVANLPPDSPEGTALEVVRTLLDCQVNLVEGAPPNKFSRERDKCLFISLSELPLGGNILRKFQALLLKRIHWEKEPVAFLVQCYLRSLKAPAAAWVKDVWSGICVCTQQTAVSLTMEQLVQVEDALPSDDIWSQYRSHSTPRAFLECVNGSSPRGIEVPPEMLSQVLTCAKTTRPGKKSIANLIYVATDKLPEVERVDEVYVEASKCSAALLTLLENTTCMEILCDVLEKEVEEALTTNGQCFQKRSFLGHILSPSPVFIRSKKDVLGLTRYAAYLAIRGFPQQLSAADVNMCHMSVRQGINKCQDLAFSTLRKITKVKGPGKANVLAWLAAVVTLNEKRTGPRYDAAVIAKETVSDGFMLNLCTVLLRLMQSLYTIAPTANLEKVDPRYSAAPECRLPYSDESCFAKGTINCAKKSLMEQFFVKQTDFNFMTECFHITQRALHVGLGPTLEHMYTLLRARLSGQSDLERTFHLLVQLGGCAQLLDPAFALFCSQFYITYCVWINMQFESCRKGAESEAKFQSALVSKLCQVPLYPLKDMEKWFQFLIIFDPVVLAGLQLAPLVDCCVTLLQHSEILSDPVTQTRVVSILSAFIESDKHVRRKVMASGWGSGAAGNLSAVVHGSPMVKEHLGPALLQTYIAVDTAEGVDVDKEDFEKYGARSDIMNLLKALWQRGDCRESILKSCGTVTFQSFLHGLLDMLSYFLHESLCRLMDIGKFEKLKYDSARWDTLSPTQKKLKEKFYDMDKRWARGCNIHGAKLLEFFTSWTDETPVVLDLCRPPLSGQAAASMCEFLESLCGPQASQLKVLDMDSYRFDPPAMLKNLCLILSRLWSAEHGAPPVGGFFHSMAAYPDYSHKAVAKAVSVINSHSLLPRTTVDELTAMVTKLEALSKRLGTFVEVDEDDSWCDAVGQLTVDTGSLLKEYVTALDEHKYDGTELVEMHSYAAKALSTEAAPNASKVRAILSELEKLQGLLQVHLDSSIFIRQDEDHMDLVRAIITGPKDTPYSRGCFVFDVYFPERYPEVSPLVKIVTTGNSTVRFNPNLYRDGKVCLSLLGTFHGGDATEKWNPKTSSMYQVLISIQGLIMNAEPMYNEPGYSDLQGTPEGNDRSSEYNARLHPSTVRYAMLEQLRHPPLGFEEVIQEHFRIQKPLILQQCAKWLQDSPTPQLKKRLRKAVAELRQELNKL